MSQTNDGISSNILDANRSTPDGRQVVVSSAELRAPVRGGLSATDARALEHQRLARQLEQSHADTLRIKREKASQGSTEDADYLFALSLAQEDGQPYRWGSEAAPASSASQDPAISGSGVGARSQTLSVLPQTPPRASNMFSPSTSGSPSLVTNPDQNSSGKKRGIFKSLFGSRRPKKDESDTSSPFAAANGGLSADASSEPGDVTALRAYSLPPLSPLPPSDLDTSTVAAPCAAAESDSMHTPGAQERGAQRLLTAASTPAEPANVAALAFSGWDAGRCQGEDIAAGHDEGEVSAKYRELLQTTQALHDDLQKTLTDKEDTMGRLDLRGEELQESMRSVQHSIDTAEGWEAFSLLSQQQADLEGRVRLGRQQQKLLRNCMHQLQDMQAHVLTHQPHYQDVLSVQDATFSELYRRLKNLEVEPSLDQPLVSPDARQQLDRGASAEGPEADLRSMCRISQNINFAGVIAAARRSRITQEHALGDADSAAATAELAATLANRSDGGARAAPVSRNPLDDVAALEVEERALAAQQAQLDAEAASPSETARSLGYPGRAMQGEESGQLVASWVPPTSGILSHDSGSTNGGKASPTVSPPIQWPADDRNSAAAAAAQAAASAAAAHAVATRCTPDPSPSNRWSPTGNRPGSSSPGDRPARSQQLPEFHGRRAPRRVSEGTVDLGGSSGATPAIKDWTASLPASIGHTESSKLPSIRVSVADTPAVGPKRVVANSPSRIPFPPNGQQRSSHQLQRQQQTTAEEELDASKVAQDIVGDNDSGAVWNSESRVLPTRLPWHTGHSDVDPTTIDAAVGAELQILPSGKVPQGHMDRFLASPDTAEVWQNTERPAPHSVATSSGGSTSSCEAKQEDDTQASLQQSDDSRWLSESKEDSEAGGYGGEYKAVRLHRPAEPSAGDEEEEEGFSDSDSDSTFHRQRLQPLECITEETASVMADTPSSQRSTAHGSSNYGSGSFGSALGSLTACVAEAPVSFARVSNSSITAGSAEVVSGGDSEHSSGCGDASLANASLHADLSARRLAPSGDDDPSAHHGPLPPISETNGLIDGTAAETVSGGTTLDSAPSESDTTPQLDTSGVALDIMSPSDQLDAPSNHGVEQDGGRETIETHAAEVMTITTAPNDPRGGKPDITQSPYSQSLPSDLAQLPSRIESANASLDNKVHFNAGDLSYSAANPLFAYSGSGSDSGSDSVQSAPPAAPHLQQPVLGVAADTVPGYSAAVDSDDDDASAPGHLEQSAVAASASPDDGPVDANVTESETAAATTLSASQSPVAGSLHSSRPSSSQAFKESAAAAEQGLLTPPAKAAADDSFAAPSPAVGSLSESRVEERRKRAERQTALDFQRKELEERRRVRKETNESGPRVRFALDDADPSDASASCTGGLLPGSYPPAAAQRSNMPRPQQPASMRPRRSSSIESLEALVGGRPPGHVRTASGSTIRRPGSQERQNLARKAAELRSQMQDPSGTQRRSDVQLQLQRLEIMSLLSDHRHAERSAAAALAQEGGRGETAGHRGGLQTPSQRGSARDRERIRRERETRARSSRNSVSSLASDSASLESCSDTSSMTSSRSPLEMRSRPSSIGKRTASMPLMSGSANLPTLSMGNGDGDGARPIRRTADVAAPGPVAVSSAGFSSSAAAALSSTHAMTEAEISGHFRALAAEIRLQDNVPLAAAASFLAEIQSATKGRPSAVALGIANWPSRKVAALGECIEGWHSVQLMTSSLQQWQPLPGFSSSDECTRIETYLRIVTQTWASTGGSEAFLHKCSSAGVRWSPDISVMLRRASLQLPKAYLEQVGVEATGSTMQLPEKQALLRDALSLTQQVEDFAGGLDRESGVQRKRIQNLQASLDRE